MNLLTAKSRITIGLASLLVSVLCTAMMIGIVPERRSAIQAGRADNCETIAIASSDYISRGELGRLKYLLQAVVKRNDDILSAGLRRANGELVASVGGHARFWVANSSRRSTDTQVHVPIRAGHEKWGAVELSYRPLEKAGLAGYWENPWFRMTLFVASASYLLFYVYLNKMLQHLDPSQSVPKRVRTALDSLAEGLLVIDKDQRIVLANQSFANWVGSAPVKLVGVHAAKLDWVKSDGSGPLDEFPWVDAIRLEAPQAGVMLGMRRTNKLTRNLIANASPVLGHDGKYRGVLVSFDDVTQLEETKQDLRVAKSMADKANQAKTEFLANMSHEIRTPMNAILGFTEVLRRGYSKNQQDYDSYLRTIHSSGTHLLHLINDILDLSKVESGKMQVEKIACSPSEIISEVLQVLTVRAQEQGLTLDFQVDGRIPATIISDPARLRQIITNLVGNAIKFTEQGSIRVVSRLDLRGGKLEIDVVDSGIGMTSQQCEKIFDPFVQADSSTSRNYGGTGLGLTISRKFAEALGGTVTVRSVVGQGSVFTVTVETGDLEGIRLLSQGEIARLSNEPQPTLNQRWRFPAKRVLVVDDSEANRDLLTLVLTEAGLAVDEAENGKLAVERTNQQSYDVILMDMQMPVMDGYAATRLLRGRGYDRPIFALTAHAMKDFEKECFAAGCSGYLTKPIDIDHLLASMGKLLGGEQVVVEREPAPTQQLETPCAMPAAVPARLPPMVSRLPAKPRFHQIIQRFAKRLDEQLVAMDTAWQQRNFPELASLAHWLKGSGGTVGFDAFTTPAARLEKLAKESCEDQVQGTLAELRELATRMVVPPEVELVELEQSAGYGIDTIQAR